MPHLLRGLMLSWSSALACCSTSWVDPHSVRLGVTHKSVEDAELQLVFSDEFEYAAGNDSWKNGEKWSATYGLNSDTYGETFLHPSMVTAVNGSLRINARKQRLGGADYLGGQLSSWNRFCYQGGYLEVSFRLPGSPEQPGIWPAIWVMGNLVRDTYPASAENVWPFTYDVCSCRPDYLYGEPQAISQCDMEMNHRFGLNEYQGRGAPELDLLETTLCSHQMTDALAEQLGARGNDTCLISSLQLAPRLPPSFRPMIFSEPDTTPGGRTWYGDAIRYGPHSIGNHAFYGMYNYDTIGAVTVLNDSFYDRFHSIALYTHLGSSCTVHRWPRPSSLAEQRRLAAACRNESYIAWYLDGVLVQRVAGSAFDAFGATPEREVPQEPLYILLGLKLSPSRWGKPVDSSFPLHFEVDYVRLYQDEAAPALSCSPASHPTERWIEYHHIEFGVPGPSIVSFTAAASGVLVSLGIILAFAGSLELRPLLAFVMALVLLLLLGIAFLSSLPHNQAIWPALLPALLTATFLSQLFAPFLFAVAAAFAASLLAAQAAALAHHATPAPSFATPACVGFAAYAALALLCVCTQRPHIHAALEAVASAVAGSQAVAFGVALTAGLPWSTRLVGRWVDAAPTEGAAGRSEQVLLATTLGVALAAAVYQLAIHVRRGRFRPAEGGGGMRRAALVRRLLGRSSGEEGHGTEHEMEVVINPDYEQVELERELERELELEPSRRGSTWAGVQPIGTINGTAYEEIPPLEPITAPLVRALGFQVSSVEVSLAHLRSLLANAQRDGRTPTEAVEVVHSALLGNYWYWCKRLGVRPRSCGGEHAKLKGLALYLMVWTEAANLRHMPECLCWLFHCLCAYKSAFMATPRPSVHHDRISSPIPGPVISYSFFASTVRPLVEVAAERMRRDRMTYDDLNEFFWSRSCLTWQPMTTEPRCVASALQYFAKTHIESYSWLHLAHVFVRPFTLSGSLTYVILAIAHSSSQGAPFALYIARLSFMLWFFSLYQLLKELLDLWAESQLSSLSASSFGKKSRGSKKLLLILTLRATSKAAYSSLMGAFGVAAMYTSGCSDVSCSNLAQYDAYGHTISNSRTDPGIGDAVELWLVFWLLGGLQLGAYTVYSCFQARFPWLRLLTTPFRASRLAEKFNPRRLRASKWGWLFWLPLLVCYSISHYFLISVPINTGFTSMQLLYTVGAASLPEFTVLMLALWLPVVPISIVLVDVFFQLGVTFTALFRGKQEGVGKVTQFSQLEDGLDHLAVRFAHKIFARSNRGGLPYASSQVASGGHQECAPAGACDPEVRALFAECWNAAVSDLRSSDLLSDEEALMMRYHFVLLPPSEGGGAATGAVRSRELVDPPLYFAGALQREMDELRRHGAVREGGTAVRRASEVLRAVYSGLLGPEHSHLVERLWAQIGRQREGMKRRLYSLCAPVMQLCELLCELPSFSTSECGDGDNGRGAANGLTQRSVEVNIDEVASRDATECDSTSEEVSRGAAPSSVGVLPISGEDVVKRARVVRTVVAAALQKTCQVTRELEAMHVMDTRSSVEDPPNSRSVAGASSAGGGSGEGESLLSDFRALLAQLHRVAEKRAAILASASLPPKPGKDTHVVNELIAAAPALRWNARILRMLLSPGSFASRKPRCAEARRRVMSFLGSLQMRMPNAPPVREMQSFSVLTPVFKETIIFSIEELREIGSDGRPLLSVLQELYADEWSNFCERCSLPLNTTATSLSAGSAETQRVRLWASLRGQTLYRTVHGMFKYESALRLQARLELPHLDEGEAAKLVRTKFDYVLACQCYGDQKHLADHKAADVELLLHLFPGISVVFVERTISASECLNFNPVSISTPSTAQEDVFHSVMIRSDSSGRIEECGRVRLPCNPILGEGKPENQNLGLVFTRGERVALIDMNQDGYFEQALFMRNLLQEFVPQHQDGDDHEPVTIVGFPEHIFTQSSGFVTAIYMAMQERYFGTLFQRVLDKPLEVRFHYGHPDLMDKLHFLAHGGVSKASKEVNLSEDVFAGYKTMLRGGRVVFREYHQVMSRDLYRLVKALPLDRQVSLVCGGFGFYVVTCLTMAIVFATAFLLVLLNLGGLLEYFIGSTTSLTSLAMWMPLLVSAGLMMPDTLLVWHEKGIRVACYYLYGKIITLAPMYYLFVAQTRAYHFAHTMRWGGADYYVTKRAVSISHVPLHELFMSYAHSHFYPASELIVLLAVASGFNAPSDLINSVWMLWLIGFALLYVPFLYNPNALRLSRIYTDLLEWRAWVSHEGLNDSSWRTWWERSTPPSAAFTCGAICGRTIMCAIYGYIAFFVHAGSNLSDGASDVLNAISVWQLSLGAVFLLPAVVLACFDANVRNPHQALRPWLLIISWVFAVVWFVVVSQSFQLVSMRIVENSWAGPAARSLYALKTTFNHAIAVHFGLASVCSALSVVQIHSISARRILCGLHRIRDYVLCSLLLLPIYLLAVLFVPSYLQGRIIFQASPYFFAESPKGYMYCLASSFGFLLLVLGYFFYQTFWYLGYVQAIPLGVFSC